MKDLTAAYDSETRSQESGDSSHPGAAIDTGATPFSPREARWTLAYLGILAYLVVEYTRLPAMFPVLRVLNLGKVVIVMCLLGIALEPRARVALDRATSWIKICLVALLIVGLMAATLTKYQETTWRGFRDAGVYVLVAYLVGGIVNTGWRLKLFYWLYILLNLKMAQFVIRSYFWQRKEGVSETFLAGGVGAGSTGFFSDSADLGVAMCVAWALTIPILFSRLNKIPRLFLIGSSMTFLGAILFCGSRGALVGAAAIVAAALFRAPKKLVPVFMATMFLAGLLYLLPTANWARVRSAVDWRNDRNAQSRIALWMVGLHMLRDHPLLGVGIGNYPNAYTRDYVDPAITTRAMACHSMYIQALSETGLTGMAIVLVVLYACFRLNSHTRRRIGMTWPEERQSFEYCLALGLDLALVGFLAGAVFLSVLFYPMLWILVGLSVGLHVACARRQTESETPAPNPRMATE